MMHLELLHCHLDVIEAGGNHAVHSIRTVPAQIGVVVLHVLVYLLEGLHGQILESRVFALVNCL